MGSEYVKIYIIVNFIMVQFFLGVHRKFSEINDGMVVREDEDRPRFLGSWHNAERPNSYSNRRRVINDRGCNGKGERWF